MKRMIPAIEQHRADYWSIEETANYLNIDSKTARDLIEGGRIVAVKDGRVYYVPKLWLKRWLNGEVSNFGEAG
mgnify:CR=1 FL=1